MAEYDAISLHETINKMQEKIEKKQNACSLAESEYLKYCSQFDSYFQTLQKVKMERFQKENELRSGKFRLEEREKLVKELDSQVAEEKANLENIKQQMAEENLKLRDNDKMFTQDVHSLADQICKYREIYDRSAQSRELEELSEQNRSVAQELQDLRKCLENLKAQFPLIPDPNITTMSKNLSKIRPNLEREIEMVKSTKLTLEQRARQLEANKSLLM